MMTYSGIRYAVDSRKLEGPRPVCTMDIDGDKYTIKQHYDRAENYSFTRVAIASGTEETAIKPDRWKPPKVELGVHGSWAGYAGRNGGVIGLFFDSTNPPGDNISVCWTVGN